MAKSNKKKTFFYKEKLEQLVLRYWDKLIVICITITLFLIIFIPFIQENSLDKYDTPGLLSLSWFIAHYRFPDFQGWNPYFFGGFPQGTLYPPLFHWAVAGLSYIFSLEFSYKLVVTIAGLFIPIAIHCFMRSLYKTKSWSLIGTLSTIIMLLILPGYLGFNFDGLLDYGLGPSFCTIPLFFFFLCSMFRNKRSARLPAVLLSLMLLTNLVATLAAGIMTIFYFLLNIKNKDVLIRMVKLPVLVLLLTLFWTVPFIMWHAWTAAGYPIQGSGMISITAIVLTGIALSVEFYISMRTKQRLRLTALLLTGFLFALMNIVDMVLNSKETQVSFGPIHPLRLEIFAFLAFAVSIPLFLEGLQSVLQSVTKHLKVKQIFKRNYLIFFIEALFIALIIIFANFRLQPEGVQKINFIRKPKWDGRAMRAYKVTEVLDQSRAVIDRSVMTYPKGTAVDGLLKESSYLAPYFQSLSKSLNPKNYNWKKLDSSYIENQMIPKEKVPFLMDLLWVKNLFVIDPSFPQCIDWNKLSTFKSNSLEDGMVKRNMYLCSYNPTTDSTFIEILQKQPLKVKSSWDESLQEWWFSKNTTLFTDKKMPKELFSALPVRGSLRMVNNRDYSNIKIINKSGKDLPILLKMSYFPKWKAYDSSGYEVKLYRISPNFMAFELEDDITLVYKRSIIEILTLIVSAISVVWILFYPFTRRLFNVTVDVKK